MRSLYACAAVTLALAGCLAEDEVNEVATSSVDQGLFQLSGKNFWTYSRFDGFGTWWRANTIPVCFETGLAEDNTGFNGDSNQVPNFATYQAWLREAIEETWGRVANIRFVHYGPCPARNSRLLAGWVAIYWRNDGNYLSDHGYIPDRWTRMGLSRPYDLSAMAKGRWQSIIRHEFGHALGFAHEKDRADYFGSAGTGTSCTRSYSGGTSWTEVYDPASIMNYSYCSEADLGTLSPYDIYGVQRVYGRKPSRSIVGLGGRCVNTPGFNYTNGTVLQLYDCYGQSNDTWYRGYVGGNQVIYQMSSSSTASVLSSRSPHHYWGTWTELQTYSGMTSNNVWKLKGVMWKAIGDMCVVPRASDNRLVLEICYAGDTRHLWDWDYGVQGRIRNVGTGMCANVANASNATHTPINVYPCGNGTSTPVHNEIFTTTSRGEIMWGGKCLNVANYFPERGAELQLYDCSPPGTPTYQLWYNELFHLSGRIMHAWYEDALTVYGGVSNNGVLLQTYPYSAAPSQQWDIYF